MAKREGPPRLLTPLVWLVSAAVLAGVAYGVYQLYGLFVGGVDAVAERTERIAKTVEEQNAEGEAYKDNLALDYVVMLPREGDGRLRIDVSLANNGRETVMRAAADVAVGTTSGEDYVKHVVILDDSPTSVTTDSPLGWGETRTKTVLLEAKDDWKTDDVTVTLANVRLEQKTLEGSL
jgi:hypothetical protein